MALEECWIRPSSSSNPWARAHLPIHSATRHLVYSSPETLLSISCLLWEDAHSAHLTEKSRRTRWHSFQQCLPFPFTQGNGSVVTVHGNLPLCPLGYGQAALSHLDLHVLFWLPRNISPHQLSISSTTIRMCNPVNNTFFKSTSPLDPIHFQLCPLSGQTGELTFPAFLCPHSCCCSAMLLHAPILPSLLSSPYWDLFLIGSPHPPLALSWPSLLWPCSPALSDSLCSSNFSSPCPNHFPGRHLSPRPHINL